MSASLLTRLPDELIEAIIIYLPPEDTISLGSTCRLASKIASEHLIWRRHSLQTWRYWHPKHAIEEKKEQPPAQVKWRQIFDERRRIDKESQDTFDALLLTQQHRVARMEQIAAHGYDVKDLLLRVRADTPDDAEDVLARRYHADAVLGQIHRRTGIEKWRRLQQQQMVKLEEVLGAYDLFILESDRRGDLEDLDAEFQRLAAAIRNGYAGGDFDALSTRQKAVEVARYLRANNLGGGPLEAEYHALRNNFLSIALFTSPHTSLPLQSVAIYCAVARRLGINAKPSNYPHHVHAVVEAPPDATLDGQPRSPSSDPNIEGFDPEIMHLDPWRSDDETPRSHLTAQLSRMGAPAPQHAAFLGSASTLEIALRTGRNIMNSVQEARNAARFGAGGAAGDRKRAFPDIEGAWYGMLWAMMMLGDSNPANVGATLHRRRQCLHYLVEHFQGHFVEDVGLVEDWILPLFAAEREFVALQQLVSAERARDRNLRAPQPRFVGSGGAGDGAVAQAVKFRVGQFFQHKRYTYEGFIVGWDASCKAEARWIAQMRVDELPRGREQPFYNIVANDKSVRYVAEENIHPLSIRPGEDLLALAGKYFKRWDDEREVFISNIKEEYPDD